MQYRTAPKIDDQLSLLGYGCMRFSRKGGRIDQEKVERELQLALDAGVNYFDTAYIYPGSEEALGKFAAKNGNRERMLIASKMPHYLCKSLADFDRILDEELARLQTDHIDYYLMHMLTSLDNWQRCADLGVPEWIERKKAEGKIRRIGFSYHGGREDFARIVDADPWEFCQIQLNYLDARSQAGMDGLYYAAEAGLPVIIMEPLRGGRLAGDLPSAAKQVFQEANAQRVAAGQGELSLASWAFRWLYNLPEVTCVLSGMNDVSQVQENCALAAESLPGALTPGEGEVYDRVVEAIRATEKVPCTGCGYCMPCPKGIDIPTCFRALNARCSEGFMPGMMAYIQNTTLTPEPKNAGLCIKCGKCAKHCPQHIDIPGQMDEVKRIMEGPIYKVAKAATRLIFPKRKA